MEGTAEVTMTVGPTGAQVKDSTRVVNRVTVVMSSDECTLLLRWLAACGHDVPTAPKRFRELLTALMSG